MKIYIQKAVNLIQGEPDNQSTHVHKKRKKKKNIKISSKNDPKIEEKHEEYFH